MHRGSIHQWRKSAFQSKAMRFYLLYGISTCFQVLSPSDGQVTHVLLTRSPLLFFRWSKLRWKKKRSTCMYSARRQRSSWARIKLSYKVFETILRLLSSIVIIDLLAYCLLCCLLLIKEAPYTFGLFYSFSFQRSTLFIALFQQLLNHNRFKS